MIHCNLILGNLTCTCAADFSGSLCESQINDCASNPCYNNGQCHDDIASYSCTCQAPFTGPRCEARIKECLFHPCMNNGSCVEGTGSARYSCVCKQGFTGMFLIFFVYSYEEVIFVHPLFPDSIF